MNAATGDTGDESDERLLERLRAHDHRAFSVLVHRHTSRFYAAAFRMCQHQQDSEDIVQDSFLKLWQAPEMWDPARGAKFTTWFYRIVTNMAIDKVRRRKKTSDPSVLDFVADKAPQADDIYQSQQEQAYIERAIFQLPDRQKIALNLCFYEGLSNQEAADVMGVKVKALESLLIRAKAGIKDFLSLQGVLTDKNFTRAGGAHGR